MVYRAKRIVYSVWRTEKEGFMVHNHDLENNALVEGMKMVFS